MYRVINFFKKIFIKRKLNMRYNEFYRYAKIGKNFKLEGNPRIKNESGDPEKIVIGDNCKISSGIITCKKNGFVQLGKFSVLQDDAALSCLERIVVGNYTGIAARTLIIDNNTHSIEVEDRIAHRIRVSPIGVGYSGLGNGWEMSESSPVKIGDCVWIGADCTILKGVTIGDGSIVARASVVTKNVPPYTIVAGNPARVVKTLEQPVESIEALANKILKSV